MAEAKVKFTADTSNFNKGVRNVQSSIDGVKASVALLGTALAAVGITKLVGGISSLASSSSKAAASFETLRVQMEVLLGSSEKANKLVRQMQEFGATTPLEQKDIQQATKTLLQFGIEGENVMDIIKMLGDTSMGNGEKLQSLARSFGQLSSAGKASMEDINQMIDAGFNPLTYIAQATGESMSVLRSRVSDGKVSVQEITNAFEAATSEGGKFNNMLGRISGTTEGKLSNLADAVDQLKIAFGTGLNVGLGDLLDKANTLLPQIEGSAIALGEAAGKLLSTLAAKLPDTFAEIEKVIAGEGIVGALKSGIVSVLRDPEIKSAIEELGRLLIPRELRESGIGQAVSTVVGGSTATTGGLLAAGLIARNVAASSKGSKVGKGLGQLGGIATGGAVASIGINDMMNEGASFTNVAMATGGSLMSVNQAANMLGKTSLPALIGKLGELAGITGAAATRINGAFLAAGAVGALGGTIIGDIIGSRGRGNMPTAAPYLESTEAFNRRIQREMDQERRNANLLTDEELKASMANWKEPANTTAAEWATLIEQALNNMKMDKFFSNLRKKYQDLYTEMGFQETAFDRSPVAGIPLFGQFQEMLDYNQSAEQKNIGTSGYAPFLTSLAKVGGGGFYTGKDTMTSMQKVTNQFLAKIEKNTSNLTLTPSWG